MQNPNNLYVARLAHELAVDVHVFAETLPASQKYNLATQTIRAATSIVSNIHEGCARQGSRELLTFLRYAHGSAAELAAQLRLAEDVAAGDPNQARRLHRRAERVRFLISKLIRSIERAEER